MSGDIVTVRRGAYVMRARIESNELHTIGGRVGYLATELSDAGRDIGSLFVTPDTIEDAR
jgi:hypothetical protein